MEPEDGLLVLPAWLIDDASKSPQKNWGVRVLNGTINTLGPNQELLVEYPEDEVMSAPESILLPGFVNAHVHLYGVLAHGIPLDNAPNGFWPFLEDFWWPLIEDRLDQKMIAAAAEWVCGELLRGGTTTLCDILEAPNALPDALLIEHDVVNRQGIRAVLSFEATERSGSDIAQRGLEENIRLIETCKNDKLIEGMVSIHTTFTCSDNFILEAFDLANKHDVSLHAHCNEGSYEGERCEERYGHRTIEHYDYLGVAGSKFLASQCVHLTKREENLIAERNIHCVHMPLSNCEVGGGIAPIPELLDAGVTMGLGSDGYLNDMFEVMRGAFLIHKARLQDPTVMPAARVLKMATIDGAKALGLDKVGLLTPGFSADFQLINAQFPTPLTKENLVDQLILYRNSENVEAVMVGGHWRVLDGQVLGVDREAQRAELHKEAKRLWEFNE